MKVKIARGRFFLCVQTLAKNTCIFRLTFPNVLLPERSSGTVAVECGMARCDHNMKCPAVICGAVSCLLHHCNLRIQGPLNPSIM